MWFIISCDISNGGVAHIAKYYDSSISISFHIKSLATRLKLTMKNEGSLAVSGERRLIVGMLRFILVLCSQFSVY